MFIPNDLDGRGAASGGEDTLVSRHVGLLRQLRCR